MRGFVDLVLGILVTCWVVCVLGCGSPVFEFWAVDFVCVVVVVLDLVWVGRLDRCCWFG